MQTLVLLATLLIGVALAVGAAGALLSLILHALSRRLPAQA